MTDKEKSKQQLIADLVETLAQSESRLLEAQEVASLGFYVVDLATSNCTVSAVLSKIFGMPEDYPRTIDGWVDLIHPDERKKMLDYYQDVVANKKVFDCEYRIIHHADQKVRWMHGLGRLHLDEAGHPVSMLGTVQDITKRKLAEEALRDAYDKLESRIAERTAELAKQHRNVKHLLHSSDHERQLIAYEIHDGLAQLLAAAIMQLQAFDFLKDKQPKDAANAIQAATAMLQQGYNESRRLIAGVRPPILDESGIVEAISHLVHEQGRGKGPRIDLHSRVAFGRLDPTLENAIYRIAQEALANACKHSQSKRIRVGLLQRQDCLRIQIRDWGTGFDPKNVPNGHFGLEGIRQRAKLLGGKCSIRSKPGKGTRVRVELPVVLRDEEE